LKNTKIVQGRATRTITGLKGKSYEEILLIMKLPRCLRRDLIEVYKYTHGLYKVPERLLEFETGPSPNFYTLEKHQQKYGVRKLAQILICYLCYKFEDRLTHD
jgi:hypothetical protein